MTLYRPVGQGELDLSPRTATIDSAAAPHQPIFYPVLSEDYVTKIARDWVPAEELSEFNDHIVGLIEVVAEYRPQV